MNETASKELQVKGKQEVSSPVEQAKPGLVFSPSVDIFETDKEITVMADLPGVKPGGLKIDLRDSVLTIDADVEDPKRAEEKDLLIEYETGKFFRQFTLSEMINQERIQAKLKDGVLHLVLPKVEKAKPRTIQITSA